MIQERTMIISLGYRIKSSVVTKGYEKVLFDME
jgi:hypothetical protein